MKWRSWLPVPVRMWVCRAFGMCTLWEQSQRANSLPRAQRLSHRIPRLAPRRAENGVTDPLEAIDVRIDHLDARVRELEYDRELERRRFSGD